MLTRKQRELLQFIQERLADTGISPSFDEMKDALGLKSKSGGLVIRPPHAPALKAGSEVEMVRLG